MLPFALRGYRGDDFQFHFSSWVGLRQAWLSGAYTPGWDGLANYKLGDPRFCFYPPLSLCLGALLTTILPLRFAPAAFVWLALVLSALCMYAACGSFIEGRKRYLAALLYMASPYLLLTAITRFAVAELLAMAWLPFVLLYFERATLDHDKQSTLLLGCMLALTWLTNIPASIALAYVLLFAALIATLRQRSVNALFHFATSELVAILAAGFYLVPAFVERKWITADALLKQDFRDHFVFGPFSRLHRVHFDLGLWIICCVEVAIAAACILSWRGVTDHHRRSLYDIVAISFFFQLPLSAALWLYLPELRYVQFPFRFLSVIGAVLPLILLGKSISPALMKGACVLMGMLAFLPIIFYMRIAPLPSTSLPNYSAFIQNGYPGTPEYTPAGALTQTSPPEISPVTVASGPEAQCQVSSLPGHAQLKQASVDASGLCHVQFATYFYPYWVATDENGKRLQTLRDNAGLLIVEIPKGQHIIHVSFDDYSWVRVISIAVSFASILYFLIELWRLSQPGAPGFPMALISKLNHRLNNSDLQAAKAAR